MLQKKLNVLGMANDNDFQYQSRFTQEERQQKFQNVFQRMGEQRALVVIEKHRKSQISTASQQTPWKIFVIDKSKNLVEFLLSIKQNLALGQQSTSIFLYCNNKLLMMRGNMLEYLDDLTVGQIYDSQKNEADGHLYIKYADFETFGLYI